MNREPKRENPRFILVVGEQEVECTPETTSAFMHQSEADRHYDHIWHVDDTGEQTIGYYIWREDLPNFNEVISYMYQNGFDLARKGKPMPADVENYKMQKGEREASEGQGKAIVPNQPAIEAAPPKPEDLPTYGNTKEKKIKQYGQFISKIMEDWANGIRHEL